MEISKQDWLLFRQKIGEWQEAYMGKLLREYSEEDDECRCAGISCDDCRRCYED